ncbi:MAG: Asd/ArgC dimerization domain-containing protein [Myxococcota bacterium]
MEAGGLRIGILGATGAVGGELLGVLEERGFPVRSLRAFASERSEGARVDFCGEAIRVEAAEAAPGAGCELVFNAARVLPEGLLEALEEAGSWVIDLSGASELDPVVPLFVPGVSSIAGEPLRGRRTAVPRGSVAGLALALGPLAVEAGLERVTALCLESAAGAGRAGVEGLTDQTVHLLNAMTGEDEPPGVFPRPLAFDCLPLVGEGRPEGETSEERRLVHVLRRFLGQPGLPIETTRVRVPIFSGSLSCVHVELSRPLAPGGARALWEKRSGITVLPPEELPTPRTASGRDELRIGRVRASGDPPRRLAFVIAMDDLRLGSALAAVLAAEAHCRLH